NRAAVLLRTPCARMPGAGAVPPGSTGQRPTVRLGGSCNHPAAGSVLRNPKTLADADRRGSAPASIGDGAATPRDASHRRGSQGGDQPRRIPSSAFPRTTTDSAPLGRWACDWSASLIASLTSRHSRKLLYGTTRYVRFAPTADIRLMTSLPCRCFRVLRVPNFG